MFDPTDPDEAELRARFEALMGGGSPGKGAAGAASRGGAPSQEARAEDPLDEAPEGTIVGTVTGIAGDDVFVELGVRRQGVLSLREFDTAPPRVGERVEVSVLDDSGELWTLSRKEARRAESWRALAPGKWVKATFTGANKGGLSAKVGPIDAFVPFSQIDVVRVDDATPYVGRSETCEVVQADVEKGRVVLSRRKVIEAEREEQRKKTWAQLAEGMVREGRVARVEGFGAFVEIAPGVEGLVHISNIGHRRLRHAGDVLKVGQSVEVVVLSLDPESKRIGLGMKQIGRQPWEDVEERYPVGRVLEGVVTRVADFGAFVELEPGVEGLVHVSELSPERVKRTADAVQEGQQVRVRVLGLDLAQKRMSLSRKNAQGALLAEAADLEEEAPGTPPPSADGPRGTNLGDVLRQAMERPKPR